MKVALTPLEFARRARRLYAQREAVIDGDLRLTYEQFLARCDRWSASLQKMGIQRGDRVAYIAPNTHAQLESFYAVPQIGAVLVPINYRLTAEDFAYIVNHSGARVLCVHSDYLDVVEGVRRQLSGVEQFVALEGFRDGWLDYEGLIEKERDAFASVEIDEDDLITINYTSGTTARPKGVMITIATLTSIRSARSRIFRCPRRIGISGRCRCFTPTDGPSCGLSRRAARCMSVFARSTQR